MGIQKANITVDGNDIHIEIPFMKVDKENRTVHGFATLDNVDSQGDIITQKASLDAFKSFRGNIREMHQPKAVGRLVDYRPDMYVDKATGEVYNGVYVSAYISKGAPDTWEKVLDGTLTGFSIGGGLVKAEPFFDEKADAIRRRVDEYDLSELSLVDNPANKFANILTIEKSDTTTEILSKTVVYWCDSDGILSVDDKAGTKCPTCNKTMQDIGFLEQEPTKEVLKGILRKFKDESNDAALVSIVDAHNARNGTDVKIETVTAIYKDALGQFDPGIALLKVTDYLYKTTFAVDDLAKSTDNPIKEETMAEETETVEVEVAKSDSPSGDADLVKAVAEITESVKELTTAFAAVSSITDAVKSLADVVGDLKKSMDTEIADVKSKLAEVQTDVTKFDERVEAVEADTAVKKSSDVGGITEGPTLAKSKWGGRFLSTADLLYR